MGINEKPDSRSLYNFQNEMRKRFGNQRIYGSFGDPISFLNSLEWNILGENFFDQFIKAIVLLENLFPKEEFYLAEVSFEDHLLRIFKEQKWPLKKIMQAENFHPVILWGERQFDPYFKFLDEDPVNLRHGVILEAHLIWEWAHAVWLRNQIDNLENKNTSMIFELMSLYKIQNKYGYINNISIKENIVYTQYLLDNNPIVLDLAGKFFLQRKSARILIPLWKIEKNPEKKSSYKKRIVNYYGERIFQELYIENI